MARNTGTGAPSSRSDSLTNNAPWRRRIVLFTFAKGKNSIEIGGEDTSGRKSRKTSWKISRMLGLTLKLG